MESLLSVFWPYFLMVLALALIFGFAAQRSAFCPVGGVREWVKERNPVRLATYFGAISVVIAITAWLEATGLVSLNTTTPPYRSGDLAWGRYLIGGFIFGFGMVLAAGCGMRNLIRVGEGSFKALWLVAVMSVVAYIMTRTEFFASWVLPVVAPMTTPLSAGQQDLGTLLASSDSVESARLWLGSVIGLALLAFLLWRFSAFRRPGPILTSLVIGGVVAAGFVLTGGDYGQYLQEEAMFMETPPNGLATQSFTFAAPMGDVVYYFSDPQWALVTFGVIAVFGLAIGSLISALMQGTFQWKGFASIKDAWLSTVGAVMVGFGAVLAMGCSIGHGLTGTATLALGSFMALAAILAGAWVGVKLEKHWQ